MTQELPEIALDVENLYREESFTDQRVGIMRRLTPVTIDGADDPARKVRYLGQTQLMTQLGALPISFEIEANSFAEALKNYPIAAKQGVEDTMRELQEMRREAASSIVLPDAPGAMPGGGLGGMGGGAGGGFGGIQLR